MDEHGARRCPLRMHIIVRRYQALEAVIVYGVQTFPYFTHPTLTTNIHDLLMRYTVSTRSSAKEVSFAWRRLILSMHICLGGVLLSSATAWRRTCFWHRPGGVGEEFVAERWADGHGALCGTGQQDERREKELHVLRYRRDVGRSVQPGAQAALYTEVQPARCLASLTTCHIECRYANMVESQPHHSKIAEHPME